MNISEHSMRRRETTLPPLFPKVKKDIATPNQAHQRTAQIVQFFAISPLISKRRRRLPSALQAEKFTHKRANGKKMTMLRFYAFRIMNRDNDFKMLLRAGELSHQFIVDDFAKIETDRLNHIRFNQENLHAVSYSCLTDAVETDGSARNVGQLVVLASSFTSGPRYMHENARTQ